MDCYNCLILFRIQIWFVRFGSAAFVFVASLAFRVNEKFVMGVFFVLLLLYEFFVLFVGITSHPAHVVSAGVI